MSILHPLLLLLTQPGLGQKMHLFPSQTKGTQQNCSQSHGKGGFLCEYYSCQEKWPITFL